MERDVSDGMVDDKVKVWSAASKEIPAENIVIRGVKVKWSHIWETHENCVMKLL